MHSLKYFLKLSVQMFHVEGSNIKDTVVFGEVLFVYQKNSHGTFNAIIGNEKKPDNKSW